MERRKIRISWARNANLVGEYPEPPYFRQIYDNSAKSAESDTSSLFRDANPVIFYAKYFFLTPISKKFTPVRTEFFYFDCTLTLFLLSQILRCRRVYRRVRAVSSILVLAENP